MATTTAYMTLVHTSLVTKISKETITVCEPNTDSLQTTPFSKVSREKTSEDSGEKPSRLSTTLSAVSTTQMAPETSGTSSSASASTSASAEPLAVLHGETDPHFDPICSCFVPD